MAVSLCAELDRRKSAKKPRSGSSVVRSPSDHLRCSRDAALGASSMHPMPCPSGMHHYSGVVTANA